MKDKLRRKWKGERQKAKGKRQKAEGRRQKAKGRRQKLDGLCFSHRSGRTGTARSLTHVSEDMMATQSNKRSSEIQSLMDRAAIHDLLTRYHQGLDRSDPAQGRGCFTEDISAHYDKRTPAGGRDGRRKSPENFS